ncbi:MAG: Rieske 2Fe-2S domain-containing protein [Acidobacteriaceae bacterium]
MSDHQKRNSEIPVRTADAAPARNPEEIEPSPGRSKDRSSEGRSGLAFALLIAGLSFAWRLVKGFITSAPAPVETAATAPLRPPQKTGRATDRNLARRSESTRRTWGTLWVACAFTMGIAAGIGFLFIYWSSGSNLLLGITLALSLGGFGLALVLSSHWLMPDKQATEPRAALPSPPAEREAAVQAYCADYDVQRRRMLKWMGAAGTGLLAAIVISLMRSLGMSPDDSLFTTVWKRGQRLMTVGGKPISVDSLEPGSSVTVFPEDSIGSEKSQTVLVRVKEQLLELPEGRAHWAPSGYVAYSRVCTHAGCPVGMFESGTNLLLCPCHQSTFDVLTGARPTSGPAARPLPQLPLYADSDGTLRAAGGFTAPPGPGFWGMP